IPVIADIYMNMLTKARDERSILPIFLLLLVITAPVPGYCYKNVIAEKTTGQTSPYESSILVGPGIIGNTAIAAATSGGFGLIATYCARNAKLCVIRRYLGRIEPAMTDTNFHRTISNMDIDPNGDLPHLYLIIDIGATFVVI